MSVSAIVIIVLAALLFLSVICNVFQIIHNLSLQEELDTFTHGLHPVYLVEGLREES